LDIVDINELRAIIENLVTSAESLRDAIDRNYIVGHLKELISKYYNIGDLVDVKKLDRGYVNVSYEIDAVKNNKRNKYFLRRYKRGIREEEVKFEHALIKHLMEKEFNIAASIVLKNDGKSYIKEIENINDEKEEAYFAIFTFLEGEDKYTWDNPVCNENELKSSASVLAQYHSKIYDFEPQGKRYEPRIIELLPTVSGSLMKYAKRSGGTKFDNYFMKNLDCMLSVIDSCLRKVNLKEYNKLPHLAIHCDYHPGNLKYKDEKAIGLFDFDWAKIDSRLFDIALAITYFCTTWEGKEDGDLILNKLVLFLRYYHETAVELEGYGALNKLELKYLPELIKASNLYVLNWDIDDFYIKKQNPYEYLIYIQHNVRFMRWLENNYEDLVFAIHDAISKVHY